MSLGLESDTITTAIYNYCPPVNAPIKLKVQRALALAQLGVTDEHIRETLLQAQSDPNANEYARSFVPCQLLTNADWLLERVLRFSRSYHELG